MIPIIWQEREDYAFQSVTNDGDKHVFTTDNYLYGVRSFDVATGLQKVHLFTHGQMNARDGRVFYLDNPKAVIAEMMRRAGKAEIPVDSEQNTKGAGKLATKAMLFQARIAALAIIPPSTRDWALRLCAQNEAAFDEFIQKTGPGLSHVITGSELSNAS